jgi:pilus assembly protein CpaB
LKRIYIIALLFAVITGIAVYSYAQRLERSAQAENGNVVVAVARIPENTQITEDMIIVKKLPAESINALAANSISLVKGRITNAAIEANEQVLTSRLNEMGAEKGGLAYMVPDGKRAMTIEVNDITGVADSIKKTNHVDIIASLMVDKTLVDKTEKVAKSMLLLQNVEVLATASSSTDEEAKGYTNITVAVSPEEAVKLFYAQVNGKLTAVLRPVLESDLSTVTPYAP